MNGGCSARCPGGGAGGAQHGRVEGERLVGDQLTGVDVANVEGLQRMFDANPVADLLGVVTSRVSSSSASGTAGGRGWPEYSLAPV